MLHSLHECIYFSSRNHHPFSLPRQRRPKWRSLLERPTSAPSSSTGATTATPHICASSSLTTVRTNRGESTAARTWWVVPRPPPLPLHLNLFSSLHSSSASCSLSTVSSSLYLNPPLLFNFFLVILIHFVILCLFLPILSAYFVRIRFYLPFLVMLCLIAPQLFTAPSFSISLFLFILLRFLVLLLPFPLDCT